MEETRKGRKTTHDSVFYMPKNVETIDADANLYKAVSDMYEQKGFDISLSDIVFSEAMLNIDEYEDEESSVVDTEQVKTVTDDDLMSGIMNIINPEPSVSENIKPVNDVDIISDINSIMSGMNVQSDIKHEADSSDGVIDESELSDSIFSILEDAEKAKAKTKSVRLEKPVPAQASKPVLLDKKPVADKDILSDITDIISEGDTREKIRIQAETAINDPNLSFKEKLALMGYYDDDKQSVKEEKFDPNNENDVERMVRERRERLQASSSFALNDIRYKLFEQQDNHRREVLKHQYLKSSDMHEEQ